MTRRSTFRGDIARCPGCGRRRGIGKGKPTPWCDCRGSGPLASNFRMVRESDSAAVDAVLGAVAPATLADMAKMGRPRSVAAEDDEERSSNQVVRLGERHRAELDALMADLGLADRSKAVRHLIEESAKRRARRG